MSARSTDDYSRGRCAALTAAGRRCCGPWRSAMPCTFQWDAVTGVGLDGPWIVLCGIHRRVWERRQAKDRMARMRIHRGWLGPANDYGYGTTVLASQTSAQAAKWWWARRRPVKFGERGRRDCA